MTSLKISDNNPSNALAVGCGDRCIHARTRDPAIDRNRRDPFPPEFGMSPVEGPLGLAPEGPAYLGGEEIRRYSHVEQTRRQADRHVSALLGPDLDAVANVTKRFTEREMVDGDAVYRLLLESGQVVTRNDSAPTLRPG